MPTFAVLFRYEVTSGLVIEAKDEQEAVELATEFEFSANDAIEDADNVQIVRRYLDEVTAEPAEAESQDDAEDLLDEWIDEDAAADDDEDLPGEDDDFEEFDDEEDDEDDDFDSDDFDDEDEDEDDELDESKR
ncbi:hypothetical protein JRG19_03820 [Pseudoclavibacter alba]|uniref:hypothetical protein n=1 Tax=Pseudoclavibacter albus TaxID=272241 RepID=UPI0019D19023|nr:hypothetical protein [Pseudoclavibacter alba]MBN6777680.1 hypothetical protein [Pseudoclavibacter alba]